MWLLCFVLWILVRLFWCRCFVFSFVCVCAFCWVVLGVWGLSLIIVAIVFSFWGEVKGLGFRILWGGVGSKGEGVR